MAKDETEVVSAVLEALAGKVGRERMELWLRDGEALRIEGGTLLVRAADEFTLDRIRRNLREPLLAAAEAALGARLNIAFEIDATLKNAARGAKRGRIAPADPNQRTFDFADEHDQPTKALATSDASIVATPPPAPRPEQPASGRRFANLETFVVSDASRLAHSAALKITTQPGHISPLYVHGPTGCGKTHLAEGIWCALKRIPQRTCVFLAAEQFTTSFLDSLRGQGLPSFRNKIRNVDLLVIDDIQFLHGKPATLRELLNTVEFFIRERKQLVITGDRPPQELPGLGPELAARLSGGLVTDLAPLDLATRRGVLQQMLSRRARRFPADVIDFLAESLPGDGRRLQGALNRLEATQEALGCGLTLKLAREALKDLLKTNQKMVRLVDIDKAVSEVFGIAPQSLHSDGKARTITQPRMLAMWLARKYTRAGLSEISQHFGLRSHSTVVAAQKKVGAWLTDQAILHDNCDAAETLRKVENALRAS